MSLSDAFVLSSLNYYSSRDHSSSMTIFHQRNRQNVRTVKNHQRNNYSFVSMTLQEEESSSSSYYNKAKKKDRTIDEMNELVSKMGLTPVTKKKNNKNKSDTFPKAETTTTTMTTVAKKKKAKHSDISSKQQQQQQKSLSIDETTGNTLNDILATSYKRNGIDISSQLQYSRNGHVVLRNLINVQYLFNVKKDVLKVIKEYELKAWKQKVQVASNSKQVADSCQTIKECQRELQKLGIVEQIPFLQYFNSWYTTSSIKALAYELGEIASVLLDVPTIRLYQDSIFWKRCNDGPTPWHVDAKMAPFDTSNILTFWIPLNDIPIDGTGLLFCSKSHSDYALPYWNPPTQNSSSSNHDDDDHNNDDTFHRLTEWDRLEERYSDNGKDKNNKNIVHYMPMNIGDVTVHSGWTLHCSDGNNNNENDENNDNRQRRNKNKSEGNKYHHNNNDPIIRTDGDRIALAISFVDANAEIREDAVAVSSSSSSDHPSSSSIMGDNEDSWSYQEWVHDIQPRTKFLHHPLVPIVWPSSLSSSSSPLARRSKRIRK